jgi:ech hydrogenase subunit A
MLATASATEKEKHVHHDWYMEVPLLVLLAGVFVSVGLTTVFFSQLINLPAIYGIEPSQLVFGEVLKSAFGGFSPLMFLIIFLVILLIPILLIRVPTSSITPAYSCGTGREPDLGGGYFESMIGEGRLLKYLIPVGILLLIALFVAVIL